VPPQRRMQVGWLAAAAECIGGGDLRGVRARAEGAASATSAVAAALAAARADVVSSQSAAAEAEAEVSGPGRAHVTKLGVVPHSRESPREFGVWVGFRDLIGMGFGSL
jgi:hypothetical protein